MTRVRVAALIVISVVVSACGGGASPSAPTGTPPPSAGTSTRIEVMLSDELKITPAQISVPAGAPVTFVVTNTGAMDHEFVVGDAATQDEHEQEMRSGGMSMDEPNAVALPPGQTKELTMTFEVGSPPMLAGCHVQGHYLAGMKATITVAG
jgi:uncharacterized cupredoxin-like copper-binding protein